MSLLRKAARYVGGAVALVGLFVATAFVGRRTADPVAGMVVEITIVTQILGVLGGLVIIALGLAIAGHLGAPPDESRSAEEPSE